MDITKQIISTAPLTVPLITGYLLDLLLGDPHTWPHPIKLFGNIIYKAEKTFNKGTKRILKGALITIFLVTIVTALLHFSLKGIRSLPYLYYLVATVMVFWGLANRNLIDEALKVENALTKNGVKAGRQQLSLIVGRETSQLSPSQIRTAVLETLSENLSDGVIAPLFYYLIGGLPLMFAYKIINTLDSMIGYKSERYKSFGLFAAKLDDVANYLPARLTAILMIIVTMNGRAIKFVFKYGKKHASPNAGYPESALAGILNCRFGGPNTYHGKIMQKPYIGQNKRNITLKDLKKSCTLNQRVTLLMVVINLILFQL